MAKFFICKHCGNLVQAVKFTGVPLFCCKEKMSELTPNTVDASQEKHVPVVSSSTDEVKVNIGAVTHPMEDAHYIEWIALETDKGLSLRYLKPSESNEVAFHLNGEKPITAYCYCNLHGLWSKTI